jgi:hypothetical protein
MAKNTASISPRAVGSATSGKVTTKNDQIITNNGTFDVITLGRQNDGTYGMTMNDSANARLLIGPDSGGNIAVKVSKVGYDAATATNDQLIFNSQQDVFKIVAKYTVSFTVTCGAFGEANTIFSVTHNLGYLPLYIGSANITTNTVSGVTGIYPLPYFMPAGANNGTGNNIWGFLAAVVPWTVSTTQIQFEAVVGSQNASGQTLAGSVTVYVLQETQN